MVRVARVALALYLLAGAAITLGPTPGDLFTSGAWTVYRVTGGALTGADTEALANVALFVPVGFLLCRSLPATSRWLLWALCAAGSAGIELYQFLAPGRDATVRDLVTNSLGAALGVGLSWALDRALAWTSARRQGARPD